MDQMPRPNEFPKPEPRKPAAGDPDRETAMPDAITPTSVKVFLAHAPRQPKTADAWERFEHELALALAALEEDEWLILSLKQRQRFVQFVNQGDAGLRAETVSDYYLEEGDQLSDGDRALLLKLGWDAPTNLPDAFGYRPDGSPNYFVDLAHPVPCDELAALAVATLKTVHGAVHPGVLEYATGGFGAGPRFPNLGIRRAR
jgi:hypothetical protein